MTKRLCDRCGQEIDAHTRQTIVLYRVMLGYDNPGPTENRPSPGANADLCQDCADWFQANWPFKGEWRKIPRCLPDVQDYYKDEPAPDDTATTPLPDSGSNEGPPDILDTARLCYVCGLWAWFTTQDISKQWGDDWDDAPYEHNAGPPYEYHPGRADKPWRIVKVAFEGPFDQHMDRATNCNSPYSVRDINSGKVPWLMPLAWAQHSVNVYAGTTIREFIALVSRVGGKAYLQSDAPGLQMELNKVVEAVDWRTADLFPKPFVVQVHIDGNRLSVKTPLASWDVDLTAKED